MGGVIRPLTLCEIRFKFAIQIDIHIDKHPKWTNWSIVVTLQSRVLAGDVIILKIDFSKTFYNQFCDAELNQSKITDISNIIKEAKASPLNIMWWYIHYLCVIVVFSCNYKSSLHFPNLIFPMLIIWLTSSTERQQDVDIEINIKMSACQISISFVNYIQK